MKVSDLVMKCDDKSFISVKYADGAIGLVSNEDHDIFAVDAEMVKDISQVIDMKKYLEDTKHKFAHSVFIERFLIIKATLSQEIVDFNFGQTGILTIWI